MDVRLTKVDHYQFLTCFKHGLWGSRTARFKTWREGDLLAFIVDKALAAVATVAGAPFQSRERVWDNGLFPHRIRVDFAHVLLKEDRVPVLGRVRDALTKAWGTNYGWGILNQQALPAEAAAIITAAIREQPNGVNHVKSNLAVLLDEARREREMLQSRRKPRPRKARKLRQGAEPIDRDHEAFTPRQESAHSRAQKMLIEVGRLTGCSVWLAANDRGRTYRGKRLGEGCLESLPSLGLSDEATKRIGLIDVIWIRQNAPLCAFEVETTTSVYSGLLRLADLIAVVPAININLFVVAPGARRDKVLAELGRPTFRRIGLSEFCRFVSTEDLADVAAKVQDLVGHVNYTILDTIAVAAEELPSDLE